MGVLLVLFLLSKVFFTYKERKCAERCAEAGSKEYVYRILPQSLGRFGSPTISPCICIAETQER